jgi:hypothetical protein
MAIIEIDRIVEQVVGCRDADSATKQLRLPVLSLVLWWLVLLQEAADIG